MNFSVWHNITRAPWQTHKYTHCLIAIVHVGLYYLVVISIPKLVCSILYSLMTLRQLLKHCIHSTNCLLHSIFAEAGYSFLPQSTDCCWYLYRWHTLRGLVITWLWKTIRSSSFIHLPVWITSLSGFYTTSSCWLQRTTFAQSLTSKLNGSSLFFLVYTTSSYCFM